MLAVTCIICRELAECANVFIHILQLIHVGNCMLYVILKVRYIGYALWEFTVSSSGYILNYNYFKANLLVESVYILYRNGIYLLTNVM